MNEPIQFTTIHEQDAYDRGFADGKDYWIPKAIEAIIRALQEDAVISTNVNVDALEYIVGIIEGGEQIG